MRRKWMAVLTGVLVSVLAGCADAPTEAPRPDARITTVSRQGAVKFWESGASVYWNQIARDLVVKYSTNPFAANRGYTILSTSQYNAIIAAEGAANGSVHPSVTAAVAGASAVALSYLYPAEASTLENRVDGQLSAPDWPGDANTDLASGETIGRAVAEQVVARAKTDAFFAPWNGTVPVGPGLWFSTSNPPAPPVGGQFGQARSYFLSSGDQFRPPPPPTFGSPEFLAALAEVRQISDTRTPQQTAIAQFWAFPAGTITPPGFWNSEATDLIVEHHLREREAAHVLALVNMAAFDALVACFDAKFAYWFIRPTQADPLITLAVALPNFPSYPSAHACVSGAMSTILGAMFPSESSRLDAMAEEAALSRLLGGLHYGFDNDTGLRLGRRVAELALSLDVRGHEPFVLK